MRISDWSSDVCSSDLEALLTALKDLRLALAKQRGVPAYVVFGDRSLLEMARQRPASRADFAHIFGVGEAKLRDFADPRSEEHTSELQSIMRISYDVFCLKKKNNKYITLVIQYSYHHTDERM